ncbi:MAG: rRNA pseudouridine synthase [Lentisphaerae bacterium]|nr:rRNA pseudouridine synthase [Lentisphaerota bacterium]
MVNLVKFIASSGISSRRQAEKFIRDGRVSVNGSAELNPARRIAADDRVMLDDTIVVPETGYRYILLHKPRGYVCSSADRHADKLALDLLKQIPQRLVSAGRLDKDSEGAIIFSNDGAFINRLTHPRYGILKTYQVTTDSPLAPANLLRMHSGIMDDGELLKVQSAREIGRQCYEVILNEGKKREIRRLTAACGATTIRLKRVKIGDIALGTLPPGKFRDLSEHEVALLTGEKEA